MEPVAAFGVAAGVLEFVSFATSLVTMAEDIRNSAASVSPQNAHITQVTGRLHALVSKIQLYPRNLNNTPEEAEMISNICGGCLKLAEELQQRLARLKGQGGKLSKFKSYRLALEALWDRSTIESLFQRLDMFRGEIDTFLIAAMTRQLSDVTSNQSSLTDLILGINSGVLATIQNEQAETRRQILSALVLLAKNGLDAKYPEGINTPYFAAAKIAPGLAKRMVRESFGFSAINRRFGTIPRHHARTFEWIFDRDGRVFRGWSEFPMWLRTGKGVYWISGKAGSGKSTLMKFIVQHRELMEGLTSWAGKDRLILSHHFFWKKGEDQERSLSGLLRTILHNIFEGAPDLLCMACGERVKMAEEALLDYLYVAQEDTPSEAHLPAMPDLRQKLSNWTMDDLTATFKSLTDNSVNGVKFFFLIDGLDEFEGDHEETVKMLHLMSSSNNIKVCVSSRPLALFEKVFGQGMTLRLQDLTHHDISIYVAETLKSSRDFCALAARHPYQAQSLASRIIAKASGVFLWVTLVARSLLEGLINDDTLDDLSRRLDVLPPDLEELYWHLINNIDPIYKAKAAVVFQVCQNASRTVSALSLSFIVEDLDENTVVSAPIRDLSMQEENARLRSVDLRLRSTCAGLVELQEGGTASFLHRTVGDFFDAKKVSQVLEEMASSQGLNHNMSTLKASIMGLKWFPFSLRDHRSSLQSSAAVKRYWDLVEVALCAAARANLENVDLSVELVDSLDNVASFRWVEVRETMADSNMHWGNFIQFNSRNMAPRTTPAEIFLHCAVRFQLDSYLRNVLLYYPQRFRDVGDVCLLSAAIPRVMRHGSFQPTPAPQLPSLTTIRLLLQAGEHPNRGYQQMAGLYNLQEQFTPWKNALEHIYVDFHPRNAAYGADPGYRKRRFGHRWIEVLDILLQYGADPNANLQTDGMLAAILPADNNSATVQSPVSLRSANASSIVRSPLAIVRDVARYFDPERAAALETRLLNAGAEYVSNMGDGRHVTVTVQRSEDLVDPPPPTGVMSTARPSGPGRLRSIPSKPGVREDLRKAARKHTGYFLDVIQD
ncbi:P-loop-containing protein [Rhypophila sp. PSN 637]